MLLIKTIQEMHLINDCVFFDLAQNSVFVSLTKFLLQNK